MTLHDKLGKLKRLSNCVLYKWTAGKNRIANDFILLSDLRLNVLTCDNSNIVYSSSAALLYLDKGRPVIQFRDSDILTIISGQRRGINVASGLIRADEEAAETRYCCSRIIDEDNCPKWLEDKIMSMGNSPTYPVSRVIVPELFRISKKPESLKPIFSSNLIRAIGGSREDSTEGLLKKFHDNINIFGRLTDDGFVISNDYVATGGCCVAASKGMTLRSGSAVFEIPLNSFVADISRKHWRIKTTKDLTNDMA